MKEVFTPLSLWKDTDFSAEFDTETVSSKEENGVTLKKIYFNGRKVGDHNSRVYALLAYKTLPAPCVVLVGRLDRCVDQDFVLYWAQLGFCVISVDYGGSLGMGAHTIYPPEIAYANYLQAGRHLTHVDETAKETSWYEYDFNTMRAVEYLFANNMAEDGKIGLCSYGEKGSTIAVHVLAVEKRLKTGIIMFGSIWEDDREIREIGELIEEENISKKVEQVEEVERYFSGICKQSYLQYVAQPIYLVCSANTWGTPLAQNFAAMGRCPNRNSKALFISDYVDKAPKDLFDRVHSWLSIVFADDILPKKPQVKFSNGKNGLFASVEAQKAQFYFSRKTKGRYVYWEKSAATVQDGTVKAKIETFSDTESVAVYATVYQDDLVMSSPVYFQNIKCGSKAKPDRLLYAANVKETQFVPLIVNEKESYSPVEEVTKEKGYLGIYGLHGKNFGTFAIAEYPFNVDTDSLLIFDAYSPAPQQITVKIVVDWSNSERMIFSKTVQLVGGDLWQKVSIGLKDFKYNNIVLFDNKLLTSAEVLCFESQEKIFVNNILFG